MQITPDILSAARGGDETAQAAVISHFMPKILYLSSVRLPGVEQEDLQQEGLIALFRAMERWNPSGTASFDTYAVRCIRNSITDACNRALRKKHSPLNTAAGGEPDAIGELETAAPGPEEQALSAERYRAVIHTLHTRLTPMEKRVLVGYLNGQSYREIARRLGVDRKAVENALGRVRTKLKNSRDSD